MTAGTVSPPLFDFAGRAARRNKGGHTLEHRLEQAWEGLNADGAAACPVCRARMERHGDSGHCSGCGSTLS